MGKMLRWTSALSLAVVSICTCQGSAQVEFAPPPIEEVIPDDVIPQAGRKLPNQCPSISDSSKPTAEPQVIVVNAGQRVIVTVTPGYPTGAWERCISGWTAFEFAISADGRIEDPKLITAHPVDIFQTTSLKALRKWYYEPMNSESQVAAFGGCALFFFHHPLQPLKSDAVGAALPIKCPYQSYGPPPRGPLEVPLYEIPIPIPGFE